MLFAEFKSRIEEKYKEVFPNSRCSCFIFKCLGRSISIHCYLTGNDKECAHGIIDNDMFMIRFDINLPNKFDEETEELPNDLTMTAGMNQFRVKPDHDYLYCNYKKIAYRKTRGNPAKICETFGRFVDRLYNSVCEEVNNDNIHQNDLPLIAEKIV